jgi:excinuclease ABC subunit B
MDVREGARPEPALHNVGNGRGRRVAEAPEDYALLSPSQAAARAKELEQKMHQHARDLEFEEAARARDELRRLKEARLAS